MATLGIEPRATQSQSKHSTTELHPQPHACILVGETDSKTMKKEKLGDRELEEMSCVERQVMDNVRKLEAKGTVHLPQMNM